MSLSLDDRKSEKHERRREEKEEEEVVCGGVKLNEGQKGGRLICVCVSKPYADKDES